jgi:hypothetical protein
MMKSRVNSGNARYYSVQNLLSSRLISKNLKIKIYKTVILTVVLYRCFCEHGDEPSGSIRRRDFFEKLIDIQVLK